MANKQLIPPIKMGHVYEDGLGTCWYISEWQFASAHFLAKRFYRDTCKVSARETCAFDEWGVDLVVGGLFNLLEEVEVDPSTLIFEPDPRTDRRVYDNFENQCTCSSYDLLWSGCTCGSMKKKVWKEAGR